MVWLGLGGGGIDNAFETIWGPTWKVIKFMMAILLGYVLLNVINFLVGAGLDRVLDLYTYGYKFHLVAKLNAKVLQEAAVSRWHLLLPEVPDLDAKLAPAISEELHSCLGRLEVLAAGNNDNTLARELALWVRGRVVKKRSPLGLLLVNSVLVQVPKLLAPFVEELVLVVISSCCEWITFGAGGGFSKTRIKHQQKRVSS